MFSCEYCEISNNTCSGEHLLMATSENDKDRFLGKANGHHDHYMINMGGQRPNTGSKWLLTSPYLQYCPHFQLCVLLSTNLKEREYPINIMDAWRCTLTRYKGLCLQLFFFKYCMLRQKRVSCFNYVVLIWSTIRRAALPYLYEFPYVLTRY